MVEISFVQVICSIFLSVLRSRPSRGRRVEDYLTCYAVSRASSSITCWGISTSISPPTCTLFFIEIVLKDHQPSTGNKATSNIPPNNPVRTTNLSTWEIAHAQPADNQAMPVTRAAAAALCVFPSRLCLSSTC
jgi:hypothetical protein